MCRELVEKWSESQVVDAVEKKEGSAARVGRLWDLIKMLVPSGVQTNTFADLTCFLLLLICPETQNEDE